MKLKKFVPTINSPTYFLALMDVMVVWCGVVHYSEVQDGGVQCSVALYDGTWCGILTDGYLGGLYQTLKLEMNKLLQTLLRIENQKLETLLNRFYEVSTSSVPKPNQERKTSDQAHS